jgi:alkylresorcinol/alkylpyrone synthase
VEVCGQVFSPEAREPTDIVGTALFGDGAAAALLGGSEVGGKGARILATRSVLFEETQHIMGWRFTSDGMRLVLSKDVADIVKDRLRPEVETFFADAGVRADEVAFWALHPGGRKIIDTYRDTFGLSEDALRFTRHSLATRGNLSSASVLCVLEEVVTTGHPASGDIAFVCALGPGFAAELLLVGF